jgi:hypothetical protein
LSRERKPTQEQEGEIVRAYVDDRRAMNHIAFHFKLNEDQVRKVLIRNGIGFRGKGKKRIRW